MKAFIIVIIIAFLLIFLSTYGADLIPVPRLEVPGEELPPYGERAETVPRGDIPSEIEVVADPNIVTEKTIRVNQVLVEPLKKAAAGFSAAAGEKLEITGGTRTIREQLTLFYEYCVKEGGKCSVCICNPIKPSSGFMESGGDCKWKLDESIKNVSNAEDFVNKTYAWVDKSLCPATSTIAVDAWCSESHLGNFIFDTDCQVALMQEMKKQGFCRSKAEPWHFEYDVLKVSKDCALGQDPWSYETYKRFDFFNCKRWDAKHNICIVEK